MLVLVSVVVDVVVSWVRCPVACSRGAGDQCGGRGTSLSTTVAAKTLTPVEVPWWAAAVAFQTPSPAATSEPLGI